VTDDLLSSGRCAQADCGEVTIHPWVAECKAHPKFSIVATSTPGFDARRDFVIGAEERGFDAYWINDHPMREMDTFTTLAALAVVTSRIRLMSLVSCVYYRPPVLIARGAADVDRLSGGRLVLGLGAGDDEPEFAQMGLSFPSVAERQKVLSQAVDVVQGLLSGEPRDGDARSPLAGAQLRPGPVQRPRVPLLIGGGGERYTLKQVARYADVSNFGPHEWAGGAFEPVDVRRKYEVLRRYCQDVNRDYEEILRSHWTPLLTLAPDHDRLEEKRRTTRVPDGDRARPLFATPREAIAHFRGLQSDGVEYFMATVGAQDGETVDLLAEEVVPALT
jgi:alkanesulfonate monooxygenase SsuD/methylene tetrahydromethanopterin reductase-like flavin-dependent oxidoreductase (luciferase family)